MDERFSHIPGIALTRGRKIGLTAVALLAVLLVLAATWLPALIRDRAVEALQQATGRAVRIEQVSLNPLTLTAALKGFAIEEQAGGPFLSVDSLRVSVSPASLYKRALVLSEVTLDAPSLKVIRAAGGRFNFSDILERQQKKEPSKLSAGLFPLIVQRFRVTGGAFDLEDRVVPGGRKHSLHNLAIDLPWLSTLAADADREAKPRITALVNGAALDVTASLKPFAKALQGAIHLTLAGLDLPELAAYVPQAPPVELASGRLTLDTEISFRQSAGPRPELRIQGFARLDELALNSAGGKPLLKLPSLEVRAERLEPFANLYELTSVSIEGLEAFVSRDAAGKWSFAPLLAPEKAGTPTGRPGKPPAAAVASPPARGSVTPADAPAPSFSVAAFSLRGGRIHFRDDLPRQGFKAEVGEIALTLRDIANRPGQTGSAELSLSVDQAIRLAAQGSFSLAEPAATVTVRLAGLNLQKGWPYLASFLTAPVEGTLDAAGDVAYRAREGLAVRNGTLSLRDAAVRYGRGEGLRLKLLAVKGAAFDQQANRLEIDSVRLSGGDLSLSREADGRLSAESLLVPGDKEGAGGMNPASGPEGVGATAGANRAVKAKGDVTSKGSPGPAAAPAAASPASAAPTPPSPLAYRIGKAEIEGFDLAFTDRSRPAAPHFTLTGTALSLADLRGPAPKPARFKLKTTFGKTTPIEAAGDLTPAPFAYQGNLNVGGLPIQDFAAYLPDALNFLILGGRLDAGLSLDVALKDGAPQGGFKGSLGLSDLHTVDRVEQEDLLKWRRLQIDGIAGEIRPLRLAIDQVALTEPFARIIIRQDATLNLQNLVRQEKDEGGGEKEGATATAAGEDGGAKAGAATKAADQDSGAAAAAAATGTAAGSPSQAAGGSAPPQIRVGTVTLLDGTIDFTDKHLPNDFRTTFAGLGGRISGLTSEAAQTADVDLRGTLENRSPMRITGRINPLREDLFVDLKLTFLDIDLSPLSPYSETYLGYILKQGKLFLDLTYHIEQKQLASENKVRIDQFTFGDEVASEKATSLPVKLGLALLKDRNGEINLDVPVMGRIDDPRFNIWRIVFQVVKNLLVKAVAAPFALLSSLFGDGTDLSVVAFAPGKAVLAPAEEQKLTALAKGLADRPGLKMSLTAYVDRERDAEAYRNELLERKIAREQELTLTREQQTPAAGTAATALSAAERSRYLKGLYSRESFPKPRDTQGRELALPETEMVKLLLAHTRIEREEFEALAKERLDTVRDFLTSRGGVAAERLFPQKDDPFRPPAKGETPPGRVELNAL